MRVSSYRDHRNFRLPLRDSQFQIRMVTHSTGLIDANSQVTIPIASFLDIPEKRIVSVMPTIAAAGTDGSKARVFWTTPINKSNIVVVSSIKQNVYLNVMVVYK